jgi:exonuclease SbcD
MEATMKIMHTGDWHIGRTLHKMSLIEDQRYILNKLVEVIKEKEVDILIIAGDIYDKSRPSTEAVALLNEIFTKIIKETKAKIISIAGNHDSPERIHYGSEILSAGGLYTFGNISNEPYKITLEDEYGRLNFYPIPYLEPFHCRKAYDDLGIKTQDDAFKKTLEIIKKNMNTEERNICIAHGYITGTEKIETSESERPLSIGTAEYADVGYFEGFDYVALGHIHGPQRVKGENIRYSGSLLKYSFSEADHTKTIPVIDFKEKGRVEKELLKIEPIRDLRIIKGKISDLLQEDVSSLANTEDYIMAVLEDRGELIEPIKTLRSVYPNTLKIKKENIENTGEYENIDREKFTKMDPIEIIEKFYKAMTGEEVREDYMEIFNEIAEKDLRNRSAK